MNKLDFYAYSYALLHNYKGIPFWILTPFRKIVRKVANRVLPNYLAKSYVDTGIKHSEIIVSFTSFPARIDNVWQVVECMLRQTIRPAKILLWLSKDQFPTPESIPQSLREREGEVFEIRLVNGDIRSHKKYYYVSKEYNDSLVFLIDDDIYYPTTILERTIEAYHEHPEAVICNYGYLIAFNESGNLKPYNSWQMINQYSESKNIFFGSGGGTLLRPSELYKDLTEIEIAYALCPTADDIWLNAMVRLARKRIIMLENGLILPVQSKLNATLASENKGQSMNDIQLDNIIRHYSKQGFQLFNPSGSSFL